MEPVTTTIEVDVLRSAAISLESYLFSLDAHVASQGPYPYESSLRRRDDVAKVLKMIHAVIPP